MAYWCTACAIGAAVRLAKGRCHRGNKGSGRQNTPMKLILASSSPRRAEILRNAGIVIEVCAIPVDESRHSGESHSGYVKRLALAKARAAADAQRDRREELWVVGADTIILAGGEILCKPVSAGDARRMLRRLSGTWHEVHTGLALLRRPGA